MYRIHLLCSRCAIYAIVICRGGQSTLIHQVIVESVVGNAELMRG